FCDPTQICVPLIPALKPTDISDTAVSPTLTVGYKVNDDNFVSLYGDWSHFSVNGSRTVGPAFTTIAVDGIGSEHIGGTTMNVSLDWKSNVYNVGLEYQRRLLGSKIMTWLGSLGVRNRNEIQKFHVRAVSPDVTGPFDNYHEELTEHLVGPYGGLRLSVKPSETSKFTFRFKGDLGWYFKWASLDAHNRYFNGFRFSNSDDANNGTLFAVAGLNVIYAFTKNWFIDLGYEFSWIDAVAHISNANVSKQGLPSKIVDTTLFNHAPALKLVYKFD